MPPNRHNRGGRRTTPRRPRSGTRRSGTRRSGTRRSGTRRGGRGGGGRGYGGGGGGRRLSFDGPDFDRAFVPNLYELDLPALEPADYAGIARITADAVRPLYDSHPHSLTVCY
jgi:hypothetical protein